MPRRALQRRRQDQWYGAALLRFSAHEFEADPAHQLPRLAVRPFELEPYYDEAERLLHVNRFDNEPELQALIDKIAHGASGLELALRAAAARPQARDPAERGGGQAFRRLRLGRRLQGRRRARPDRAGSPTAPNFTLLTKKKVIGAPARAEGTPERIEGVVCLDGSYYQAPRVILAAGAMTSPRILQDHLDGHGPGRAPALRAGMVGRQFQAAHQQRAHRLLAVHATTTCCARRRSSQRRAPAHDRAVPGLARRRAARDAAAGRGAEVRHQRDRAPAPSASSSRPRTARARTTG